MCSSKEERVYRAREFEIWVKKRIYTFDAKKYNAIFDWLLSNKKIKLVGRHKVRTSNEFKGKKILYMA